MMPGEGLQLRGYEWFLEQGKGPEPEKVNRQQLRGIEQCSITLVGFTKNRGCGVRLGPE